MKNERRKNLLLLVTLQLQLAACFLRYLIKENLLPQCLKNLLLHWQMYCVMQAVTVHVKGRKFRKDF